MTAFTLCRDCGTPLGENGHWIHDLDCDRFLNGWCRCDGDWLCSVCCPDQACTPLATACALAREDVYARAEGAG